VTLRSKPNWNLHQLSSERRTFADDIKIITIPYSKWHGRQNTR